MLLQTETFVDECGHLTVTTMANYSVWLVVIMIYCHISNFSSSPRLSLAQSSSILLGEIEQSLEQHISLRE